MAWMFFEDEPCQPDNFRCNRVCPRIAKAEFGRRFFSGDFRRCFNRRAKWITQLAGLFPVGVVNAPQLLARLRSHGCAHVWQFTRNRLREDVSATQNARTVRVMSRLWPRCLTTRFGCNIAGALVFISGVNRLKPFVALIVLALWASCTIRCELVSLACSEADTCCDSAADKSPEKPSPANHCVCSWVRSGGYISEKTAIPLPLPIGLPLVPLPAYLEVPMPDSHASELTFSPPELLTSWQFAFRAALSPRAPSFVS